MMPDELVSLKLTIPDSAILKLLLFLTLTDEIVGRTAGLAAVEAEVELVEVAL
jgi:hypothetical protein